MSGHTNHPWAFWEYDYTVRQVAKNNLNGSCYGALDNMIICTIGAASRPGYYPSLDEARTNAALIAAAPETAAERDRLREVNGELLRIVAMGHNDSPGLPCGDLLAAANVLRNAGHDNLAERLEQKHAAENTVITKAKP